MVLKDIIYKPESGDKIIFLKNYFSNNQSSNLKYNSNSIFFQNVEIYFENTKKLLNNYNFDELLFRKIIFDYNFRRAIRHHSFILLNNEVKIMKFGVKIKEILMNEILDIYSNQTKLFQLYYPKEFLMEIKRVQQFPNYDSCRFIDKNIILDVSENEIINKMKEISEFYEKFIINNSLKNNINVFLNTIKKDDPIRDNIFIKQYSRTIKLNEIFN